MDVEDNEEVGVYRALNTNLLVVLSFEGRSY